MANPEHLAKFEKGVREWNTWRRSNLTVVPDLSRSTLIGAYLHEAYLRGVDLSLAILREANLREADLHRADLREADLRGADFRRAILDQANLGQADLSLAILREASLSETVFADINLKDVQGLDACVHYGPSIIDHRTLAKSGPLPLPFLRGCGLSDEYIEYLPALFNQAIQFYSCFIS
jgi:uncharacterized protein YjbI with pentapeptide repeats